MRAAQWTQKSFHRKPPDSWTNRRGDSGSVCKYTILSNTTNIKRWRASCKYDQNERKGGSDQWSLGWCQWHEVGRSPPTDVLGGWNLSWEGAGRCSPLPQCFRDVVCTPGVTNKWGRCFQWLVTMVTRKIEEKLVAMGNSHCVCFSPHI